MKHNSSFFIHRVFLVTIVDDDALEFLINDIENGAMDS